MATALVARGPVRSRSTEILCVGSFSIVVDSVDGDVTCAADEDEVFGDELPPPGELTDGLSDVSGPSSRGSRASINKEETDAKLALFKTEAAARLTELERLLDEHDQIIRELKRSESQGSGINLMGCSSASSPGPQTPTLMPLASENSVSTPSLPTGKEISTQESCNSSTSKSSVTKTTKSPEGSSGSSPVFKARVDPPPPPSSSSSTSNPLSCTVSTYPSTKPQVSKPHTVTAASQTATTTTTTQSTKGSTASVPTIKVEERRGQDIQ